MGFFQKIQFQKKRGVFLKKMRRNWGGGGKGGVFFLKIQIKISVRSLTWGGGSYETMERA